MSAKSAKEVTASSEVTAGNNNVGNKQNLNSQQHKNELHGKNSTLGSSPKSARSQLVTSEAQEDNENRLPVVTTNAPAKNKTRSAPITELDVAEAYMRLVSEGIIPTVRLIHDVLQRGSFRTIQQFFEPFDLEYQKKQIEASDQPNNLSDFERVLIGALSKVCYETKVKRYEDKILTLQCVIEKLEETNTKEQVLLCENLESTQKELSEAQAVIEELNKEKATLQDQLTAALNENTKLKDAAKETKTDLKHYRELVQLIIKSSKDPDLPKTLAKKIKEAQ